MRWPTLFFCVIICSALRAQTTRIDSLKQLLSQAREDTNCVDLYYEIAFSYVFSYPDSTLSYASPGLDLARKINFIRGEIWMLLVMGEALAIKGNYTTSLKLKFQALEIAEKTRKPSLIASCHWALATNYYYSRDYEKALFYYKKAGAGNENFKSGKDAFGQIGAVYFHLNNIDSAYFYINKSYQLDVKDQNHWTVPYHYMAAIFEKKQDYVQALDFYRTGNQFSEAGLDIFNGYNGLASVFEKIGRHDSAIYYAKKVVEEGSQRFYFTSVLDASLLLTKLYKSENNTDSSFKYQEILLATKDSLFSQEKVKLVQSLSFNEQMRKHEIQQEQEQFKSRVKIYALIVAVIVFLSISSILYRSNRQKQKSYNLLEKQKQEIDIQKAKVDEALINLNATQAQLIQSEKMASLGELTAGIAHEIQNPLNFVNNFSEVNKELLVEMREELSKGNLNEASLIAKDVEDNQDKINEHGKRAESIVKGMLLHSRNSSGAKEPTDINKLADEYLRLSYHGMRAKDKNFNALIETEYDLSVGSINAIPQEIGRVLLNLFNNAFYAVHEKKLLQLDDYEPIVSVRTKRTYDNVIISVKDNGKGIPLKVIDKIFQPFFTTKPTGQGTGLGLSLAYDIVKAHGGEIKVSSVEGEFTEFNISLPA